MNLLGNALKFTASGSVGATLSIDRYISYHLMKELDL
jgi:signal transduction histidine kinase